MRRSKNKKFNHLEWNLLITSSLLSMQRLLQKLREKNDLESVARNGERWQIKRNSHTTTSQKLTRNALINKQVIWRKMATSSWKMVISPLILMLERRENDILSQSPLKMKNLKKRKNQKKNNASWSKRRIRLMLSLTLVKNNWT